ncbi:MAG: hypothetical protein QNJ94_06155 [Alphaproteobacteria bacterium]|nr:hypothetical protein [Alphaproteobacteria bacterium]
MRTPRFKLNFLTAFLLLVGVLLTLRIGGLVHDLDPSLAAELAAIDTAAGDATRASGESEIKPAKTPAETGAPAKPVDEAGKTDAKAAAKEPDRPGATGAPPSPAPNPTGGIPRDPSLFSDAEIEVLQQLAKRRAALEEREKDMEMREGLLQAAEQRVEQKISELKKLREIVAQLIKRYEGKEQQKLAALVKIYEKMKPKDAARIFDQLEMEVLLSVMQGMKGSKVAPILAAMDSKKAREVTQELAARRNDLDVDAAEGGS